MGNGSVGDFGDVASPTVLRHENRDPSRFCDGAEVVGRYGWGWTPRVPLNAGAESVPSRRETLGT